MDPNTNISALPASVAAQLTDLFVTRQGSVDKKLTAQLLQNLILGNLSGADILTKLAPVDGSGSGLDADLFRGLGVSTAGANFNIVPVVGNDGVMEIGKFIDFHETNNGATDNDGRLQVDSGVLKYNTNTVWHLGNGGPGSGLNADLLDNQQGSFYQNASNLNAGTVAVARLPLSSASAPGIIEQATQAEVNAGSGGNLAVIASTLLNGVEYNLNSSSGHLKFPSWLGNLQICWGFATVGGNSSIGDSYSRNFTSVLREYCSYVGTIGGGDSACSVSAGNISITVQNTADATRSINWLVIGIG